MRAHEGETRNGEFSVVMSPPYVPHRKVQIPVHPVHMLAGSLRLEFASFFGHLWWCYKVAKLKPPHFTYHLLPYKNMQGCN
jgi:hypothetical protein